MGVLPTDNGIKVGNDLTDHDHYIDIEFNEFVGLLKTHKIVWAGQSEIETFAHITLSNPTDQNVTNLIRAVWNWGGGQRNLSRVLSDNTIEELKNAVSAAKNNLQIQNYGEALNAFVQLNQVGISYATKLLRFMQPTHCPVLDDIIKNRLGYSRNADGYESWRGDCQYIAQLLQANNVNITRLCDIEAAIFEKLRN